MAVEWSIGGLLEAVLQQIAAHGAGASLGRMIGVARGSEEFVTRFTRAGWATVVCDASAEVFSGQAVRHVSRDPNANWPREIGSEPFDLVVV